MATSRTDFMGKTRYAIFAFAVVLGAPQAVPAQGVPWQNTGNSYGAAVPQGGSYPLNGHIELPSVYGRGRTPANSQPNIIFPCGAPYSPMGPGAQQPGAYYRPAASRLSAAACAAGSVCPGRDGVAGEFDDCHFHEGSAQGHGH